jgi:hypothetical protein
VLHDLFRRLDEAYPGLSRWVGGRLDIQLPAIGASLLTHVLLLTVLAVVSIAANSGLHGTFQSRIVDTTLGDFATLDTETALAAIDNTTMRPDAGSAAPVLSPLIVEQPAGTAPIPRTPGAGDRPLSLAMSELSPALSAMSLPGAPRLDTAVSVNGSGSEHVGSAEGAVDRIAVEILRKLEKGRTLVVWAFDASGSLQAERQRLAKYIDGVYAHIAELDRDQNAQGGGLLTAVVSFGKDRKVMVEPTADRPAIVRAIQAVPLDETGVENTFATVGLVARKYGKFQQDKNSYQTMLIVVTDERGDDDEAYLEGAIAESRKARMPVYVLGSPAVFGREFGFMDYTDPKTGETFHHVPIRQGPESLFVETIRLPFWYPGPQYELLDAGYGPWALSRLAGATGGIYFITRLGGTNRVSFDPAGMREYAPDWNSREVLQARIGRDPLRLAVMNAARITQQDLPGMPPLTFPAVESPDFKDVVMRNQAQAHRVEYTVNEALASITGVVKLRDHETSRRWQAHYDLARGRLLAVKLRTHEYNWMCAQMRKDPQRFKDPRSNSWRLEPDTRLKSSDKAESVAEEAKALLLRVVRDHPGTPWALLAQRELAHPFGFRWVEAYVPPPRRPSDAEAAAMKKAQQKNAQQKPPEPPKL